MIKSITIFYILFFFLSGSIAAQKDNDKYEKEWKNIDTLINDEDRPQTAIEEVDTILHKAIKGKNNLQVIKCLIYRNKLKENIDERYNKQLIPDLEDFVKQVEDKPTKALIHLLLAKVYQDYYQDRKYTIKNKTILLDTIPEDMKEWTKNIFFNKIIEHTHHAVKNKDLLKKQRTSNYSDIIELGKDKTRYTTLYDFLMKEAIDIALNVLDGELNNSKLERVNLTTVQLAQSADKYVQLPMDSCMDNELYIFVHIKDFMNDLLVRNMTATIVLTELKKQQLLTRGGLLSKKDAFDVLLKMEQKYKYHPENSEIINQIVENYDERYSNENDSQINEAKYKWLRKGLTNYPKSYGARKLEILLYHLEKPSLSVEGRKLLHPSQDQILSIIHKNTSTEPFQFFLYKQQETGKYAKVKSYSIPLRSKNTYNPDTLQYNLGNLDIGKYAFSSLNEKEINETDNEDSYIPECLHFTVSALMYYARRNTENDYEVYVFDRISGKPQKNADIEYYTNKVNDSVIIPDRARSNDMGIASFTLPHKYRGGYKVSLKDDIGEPTSLPYTWSKKNAVKKMSAEQLNIFLDRSIYRPGQVLYYKAIVSDSLGSSKSNMKCSVCLVDANGSYSECSDQITNWFGSIADSIVLLKSGLLGEYHLSVTCGEALMKYYFKVEEYKRPTFEITFQRTDDSDSLNNEITVKGLVNSFSGAPVGEAKVAYTIEREECSSFYHSYFSSSRNDKIVETGNLQTNADGSFDITFIPKPDSSSTKMGMANYMFKIKAIVTDINGEVQEGTYLFGLGEKPVSLEMRIDNKIEKTKRKSIHISARNLQGEWLSLPGNYTLYSINDDESLSEVYSGSLNTKNYSMYLDPSITTYLKSGRYQLSVSVVDNKGRTWEVAKPFLLYSDQDLFPAIKTNEWIVEKNTYFDKYQDAEVIYGVWDNDVYVLYQLTDGHTIFDRQLIKMSNECRLFTVPYKSIYGDEVYMVFSFVKDGKLHENQVSLRKNEKSVDKDLVVKVSSFRDRLIPGQKENWTISVKRRSGDYTDAEILASMYDASLDKIWRGTSWNFYLARKPRAYASKLSFDVPDRFSNSDYHSLARRTFSPYVYHRDSTALFLAPPPPSLSKDVFVIPIVPRFDQLNWFGYMYQWQERYIYSAEELRRMYRMSNGESITIMDVLGDDDGYGIDIAELKEQKVIIEERNSSTWGTRASDVDSKPQIRKKFNETAFFYPQLRTNGYGQTSISFTVPDVNTTWRFRAFAHQQGGQNGSIEEIVTSSKPLMVTPNLPRFVRCGDKVILSAKISNDLDSIQSGEIRIEFFDPRTEKIIDMGIENSILLFAVNPTGSQSVKWKFKVPEGYDMLGCRIIAESPIFSDGEQHLLPILPNKILVTESLPIDVHYKGKNNFIFDKLEKQVDHVDNYRLTFQYTDNPIWYILKALPALMRTTDNDNAVSVMGSYYANEVVAYLLKKNPRLYNQLNNKLHTDALSSNKNDNLLLSLADEDIKSIVIEETPWLMESEKEVDFIQELKTLLEWENQIENRNNAKAKIVGLMTNDGGWSWRKGMNKNTDITLYMLYCLNKLRSITDEKQPYQAADYEHKALLLLDKYISENFACLKTDSLWQSTVGVDTRTFEYAYIHSYYKDVALSNEAQEAVDFYLNMASQSWINLNLYQRALLVTILNRKEGADTKQLTERISSSIREYAIKDDNIGMYWSNNNLSVFMSESNIMLHSFLTEALIEQGSPLEEQEMLKRWILCQKQARGWQSPVATMSAINSLLTLGTEWMPEKKKPTTITIGSTKFKTDHSPENIAGNYVKKVWSKNDITNDKANVQIKAPNNIPGYGALFWQYYEAPNKISPQKGNLNIEKQLYKEVTKNGEKGLVKITDNTVLEIGDKVIVRFTVTADRDMQYVHLKDMRASCFKPVANLSETQWADGLRYYQTSKDASTHFFIDRLPKGKYTLQYPVFITYSGEYTDGIATIQCMYAPQFISHMGGAKLVVK